MENRSYKAWLYLLPAILFLGAFLVYPLIYVFIYSFEEGYNSASQTYFGIGSYNYSYVLHDPYFLQAVKNTFILVLFTVPVATGLALLISVGLNSIQKLRQLYQTVFFLPYVTNSIAIGMVFAAMFNIVGNISSGNEITSSMGIVNDILGFFGIDYVNWMSAGSEYWANIAVMVIYIVWNALPFKILILLGGLQSVNKQYYDAARVDSAPRWRVLTRITIPLLSPMLAYVIITGFIGGFKEYSSIVGIFGEGMGPADDAGRLNTMVGFIYDSLKTNSQGRASAAALILFGIILAVTLFNNKVIKKHTHY